MFVISTCADTIRIMPHMFHQSTQSSVHFEIDKKYPNRVIMDVGLVICRYGAVDLTQIGDGVCVPGDGAAHHEVIFRLVVFRPFVEEVLIGNIFSCNEEGIRVQLGNFFYDVFIPAYWMLRPTEYDRTKGIWVWMPQYDDEYDDDNPQNDTTEEQTPERYEMEIGAEIRFKVKGINFTQVINTAKGVQATMSSMTSRQFPMMMMMDNEDVGAGTSSTDNHNHSSGTATTSANGSHDMSNEEQRMDYNADTRPVRKRSSSFDTTSAGSAHPACMTITGSICEDGLGLVSWWSQEGEEEENDDEVEE